MIRLYEGHIYLAMAIGFAIVAGVSSWFFVLVERGNAASLIWFGFACLGVIGALFCAAFAYVRWVPSWERDEKRTGHIPGERREQ